MRHVTVTHCAIGKEEMKMAAAISASAGDDMYRKDQTSVNLHDPVRILGFKVARCVYSETPIAVALRCTHARYLRMHVFPQF